MKEYHMVFEGFNKFQKEETMELDYPPSTYSFREYEQLTPYSGIFASTIPSFNELKVKERRFFKRTELYALGKNIVYYTEER